MLEFIYLRETIESSAVPRNFPEEHIFRSYPIGLVSIESLINHHALLSLGVEGRMDELVFAALKVLEISFFLCRKLHQHFLGEGSVPGLYLLLSRRMTAREMEGLVVVLQEGRGEVSQGVLLTKKSPHTILIIGVE